MSDDNNDAEFAMWWTGHEPILTHPAFPLRDAVKAGWDAARALHGQPVSLTQEDVALLDRCRACVGWKHEEAVDALMRRVAALLPPA